MLELCAELYEFVGHYICQCFKVFYYHAVTEVLFVWHCLSLRQSTRPVTQRMSAVQCSALRSLTTLRSGVGSTWTTSYRCTSVPGTVTHSLTCAKN